MFSSNPKAAFLICAPLSTVCLNGPRSTVMISSFLIGVSWRVIRTTSSILSFNNTFKLLLKTICERLCREFFLTARSCCLMRCIKILINGWKYCGFLLLWAENLNERAHVATVLWLLDRSACSRGAEINSGCVMNSFPIDSLTMFLMGSSSLLL